MAFPTIPTAAASRVLWQLATSPSGTHTSPSLTSLTKNANDLLIAIIIIYDGNSTNAEFSSWGGGFTEFGDFATTTTMGIGCAYKWSTGSETGTFTVTSADTSTNDSAFCLLSIPGAHKTTAPEAGQYASSAGAPPAVAAALNPANWGTEDTLWIAVGGSGETALTGSYTGIASAPTNYTDYSDSGMSADAVGAVEGAVAFRQLNAASEGPGAWTGDTSSARGAAIVIAVRPDGDKTISASGAPGSATGSASLVHIPEVLVPHTIGASTASVTTPNIREDIDSPISAATASVVAPVLPKSPTIISPSGDATASVVSQIPEILVTSISLSTASVVSPTVTTQVTIVAPANDSTASAVTPTITLDVVSPAAEATASIVASTPEILLTANATATASIVESVPLITVTSVSIATASVDAPVIIVPALTNYANVLIFGN